MMPNNVVVQYVDRLLLGTVATLRVGFWSAKSTAATDQHMEFHLPIDASPNNGS